MLQRRPRGQRSCARPCARRPSKSLHPQLLCCAKSLLAKVLNRCRRRRRTPASVKSRKRPKGGGGRHQMLGMRAPPPPFATRLQRMRVHTHAQNTTHSAPAPVLREEGRGAAGRGVLLCCARARFGARAARWARVRVCVHVCAWSQSRAGPRVKKHLSISPPNRRPRGAGEEGGFRGRGSGSRRSSGARCCRCSRRGRSWTTGAWPERPRRLRGRRGGRCGRRERAAAEGVSAAHSRGGGRRQAGGRGRAAAQKKGNGRAEGGKRGAAQRAPVDTKLLPSTRRIAPAMYSPRPLGASSAAADTASGKAGGKGEGEGEGADSASASEA